MPRFRAIWFLLAGLPLALLSCNNANQSPPKVGVQVGNIAPEMDGEDADGVPLKLSDYRGKVVLLDFWATY